MRWFRDNAPKLPIVGVTMGFLALSFDGQVAFTEPFKGRAMAVVFAATYDLATIIALSLVLSAKARQVRVWAWAVLIQAGTTSLVLNTADAVHAGAGLPLALLIGAGPAVLAWVVSHLVALSLTTGPAATRIAPAAGVGTEVPPVPEPAPVAAPPMAARAAPHPRQELAAEPAPAEAPAASGAEITTELPPVPTATPTGEEPQTTSTPETATEPPVTGGRKPSQTETGSVTSIERKRNPVSSERGNTGGKDRARKLFHKHQQQGRLAELTAAALAEVAGVSARQGRNYMTEFRAELEAVNA